MSTVDRSKEPIDWDTDLQKSVIGTRPDAKYGVVSESLRHTIPQSTACTLFCGGKKCKYCTSSHWSDDQMAVQGLFSNWVTDNILATARPTTEANEKYNIIEQFRQEGIKSIINLQTPGEHAGCGPSREPSGFSYDPQDFMDNDVFFYNFGWPDYNVGSLSNILDMVKVMQFALSEGKVAIHCHAGLGRTGVMIAAYLVFANRMDPHEAVHYIRSKRPGAIQTRTQVMCIEEFAQYLRPFRVVFSGLAPRSYEYTLSQYLIRQRHVMHGFEARQLKHIPKLIYVGCERLLELANKEHHKLPLKNTFKIIKETDPLAFNNHPDMQDSNLRASLSSSTLNSSAKDINSSKSHSMHDLNSLHAETTNPFAPKQGNKSPVPSKRNIHRMPDTEIDSIGQPSSHFFLGSDPDLRRRANQVKSRDVQADKPADIVASMMAQTEYAPDVAEQVESYKVKLNEDSATWKSLQEESDGQTLAKLIWDWLDHLKEPLLSIQDIPDMLNYMDDPMAGMAQLDKGARCTVDYIFKVVVRLEPLDEKIQFELVQRILSVLTHQNVIMDLDLPLGAPGQSVVRRTSNLTEMGSNLAMKLTQFFFHVMHVQGQQLQAAKASEEEAPENKKPDGTGGKKRSSRVQKSSKH